MVEREKTNSITKLVKIVAREEAEKVFGEKRWDFIAQPRPKQQDREKYYKEEERVNALWTHQEELCLAREFNAFVAETARVHGRGTGGVLSRLARLVKNDFRLTKNVHMY